MEYCTTRQIQSQDNNVNERREKSSAVRFVTAKFTSLFAVPLPYFDKNAIFIIFYFKKNDFFKFLNFIFSLL